MLGMVENRGSESNLIWKAEALPPSSGSSNQPISDQTEPEIDDQAEVRLELMVASRGRKRRYEDEIHHIP